MIAPPPRRPWWKRKRTWAAAAVWLVVAYPASMGPASYAVCRNWLPFEVWLAAYKPLNDSTPDPAMPLLRGYNLWWLDLAGTQAD